MSQDPINQQHPANPSPYDPYSTLDYQTVPAPSKPGSVTFLAIVAIVFGGLGSICSGFGAVTGLIQLSGGNLFSGPAGQFKISPNLQAFGVFDSVIELALYVTLLMIGVSALSLKPWARRAAVSWWSAVVIIWTVIRMFVQVVWIFPASMEMLKQMQKTTPGLNAGQMQPFMTAWIVIVTALSVVIQLLPPVLFLALWRRAAVTAAFEGSAPGFTPGPPNPYTT